VSATAAPSGSRFSARRLAFGLLRLVITTAAFAYLFSLVDRRALWAAFRRLPAWAMAVAVGLGFFNVLLGTVRWRALLAAYRAPKRPRIAALYRVYLVGLFYNTFLPGAVGGDVVRGVATRASFAGEGGATAAIAVVFVERVLGMCGLLLISAGAFLVRPVAGVRGVVFGSALGLVVAAAAVTTLALGQRLARFLPGPLAKIAASLPPIARARPFLLALALSLGTQTVVALTGHVLVSALDPRVVLGDSLVMVPLAMATSYLPITVAGAGAREAAYVALYGLVGVARVDALAGSLLVFGSQLVVGAAGGIATLLAPVALAKTDP
jgi:uncharacterized membrane protein YbhN (UPF0104 family)